MEFLYPKSRKFPFDEVCEQIVRALEARNWQVPGVTIEFDVYGSGETKFRMVRYIRGQDFALRFCRVQGLLAGGRWNNIAAVTEIIIPEQELHVYEDESGPTYYLYVGGNWERDREQFLNSSKINSKLSGKPKIYLRYTGGCDCRDTRGDAFEAVGFLTAALAGDSRKLSQMKHTHTGQRSPLLVHTNDLNREYDPEGDEPWVFRTDEVFDHFTTWLKENLLSVIEATSLPAEKLDIFPPEEVIPWPSSIGAVYAFGDHEESSRIIKGRANPNQLDPSDRYALMGNGYRLLALSVGNDGTVPEIAYEGFKWCGMGEVTRDTPIESLEVPGHYRWSDREPFVLRVTPNRANGIYVADHARHEARRKEVGDAMEPGRDHFTDAEVAEFDRARARTIIPISEYKGDFVKPVVLICRELGFDEVEAVSGPHKSRLE